MSALDRLTLVVVGADEAAVQKFAQAHSGLSANRIVMLANGNRHSLASIGNSFLDQSDILGLCHADTKFSPGSLEVFAAFAAQGAVAGIVGIDMARVYRWCYELPGPVSTLDGCSVFFRRDLGIRFDAQTFTSFHCHVEDLCLQAGAKAIPVVVPQAEARHDEVSTKIPEWQDQYWIYRARLGQKWAGAKFETT